MSRRYLVEPVATCFSVGNRLYLPLPLHLLQLYWHYTHRFKTESTSLEGSMSCAFVYAYVNLHVWPCMCVWRSYGPTAGVPRPLLRMWGILRAPTGCESVSVRVFYFLSGTSMSAIRSYSMCGIWNLLRTSCWIQLYRYSGTTQVSMSVASRWWSKHATHTSCLCIFVCTLLLSDWRMEKSRKGFQGLGLSCSSEITL